MPVSRPEGHIPFPRAQKSHVHPSMPAVPIRRSVTWTGIGDAVYAACQWGLLMVLARLGTPEMVGQFALALAVTAPVIIFSNLGLRPLQSTDACHQFAFGDYLTLRLSTNVVALGVITVLAMKYRLDTAATILAIAAAKCVESVSDVYFGLLQKHERMDLIAISLCLKGVLSVAAFTAGFLVAGTVFGASLGLLLVWSMLLAAYDVRNGHIVLRQAGHALKMSSLIQIRTLLMLALPLGIGAMLLSLNSSVPRYFVEFYWGERALGIFAGLAYVVVAMGMLVNSVGQSLSPRLSQYWTAGSVQAFKLLLAKFALFAVLWGLLGVTVSMIGGAAILRLLYGPDFAAHSHSFAWLMAVGAISHLSSVCGFGMTAARIIRSQSVQFAAVALVGLVGSLVLVPRFGINGAVWAFGASLLTQLLLACACLSIVFARREKQSVDGAGFIPAVEKA